MKWAATAVFLLAWAAVAHAQQMPQKCNVEYKNHNQVDYGPLVLRHLSGVAIDPSSVAVPGICIGLFSDKTHQLIASTVTDEEGKYSLPDVAPGRYRVVSSDSPFCPASVPIEIVRWPRGQKARRLLLHMKARAIDVCTYGDYK